MVPDSSKAAPSDIRDPPVSTAALREIGLFGALGDAAVELLARTLTTSRATPGETIVLEGDGSARDMYVVLDGEFEVTKSGRLGKDKRIAILGPGDWFGEMSLIDMQPRSATVRALAPSRLLRMTSEHLDSLYRLDCKSYALIVLNMARDLSRRLRVTDAILADGLEHRTV